MGIPYYFYTVYKKYHGKKNDMMIDENRLRNLKVDHLFFDFNSMIHPCAHKVIEVIGKSTSIAELEKKIIEECMIYTRYVISVLTPSHIYIMIDGVAPRAKMNQQRERRYKSQIVKDQVWDSNRITPGTPFMASVRRALDKLKKDLEEKLTIIISDSDECGEGEHKMMKVIVNLKGKIVIYGLDGDLIMLSLMHPTKDIVLLRDNTFNDKLQEHQKVFTYLDIKQLGMAICDEVKAECRDKELSNSNIINDYIFLCFMFGNDFLGNLPSLMIKENGVNTLTKYYVKTLMARRYKPLIECGKIDFEFLKDLLWCMKSSEDYFFSNVYSVYKNNKVSKKTVDNNNDNSNIYLLSEDCIQYNKVGYKARYYLYYGIKDVDVLCHDYIEGLSWVLGYYNGHKHENWSWYYKHHCTPFVSDLYSYISKTQKLNMTMPKTKPHSQLEQLFMVLPKSSLITILSEIDENLCSKVKRVLRSYKQSDDLCKCYPDILPIDMIHKEYLWQGKILFEPYNQKVLKLFFN